MDPQTTSTTSESAVATPAEALGPLVSCGNFLFRFRNAVFPVVMLPLLILFRPWVISDDVRLDMLLDAIGASIVLGGVVLRMLVIGFKYVKRGGMNKKVYADKLVVEGFFNHCRNPLYVGNVMIVLGLLVIHGNPWVLALGGAFFGFAYIAIIAAEENYLSQKFGQQYQDYCRRVSRWWINPIGLRRSLAGMRFKWARVVVKEYGSTALALWSVVGLLAYERWANHALYLWSDGVKLSLGIAAGLIAIAYCIVRLLKKSGTLHDVPDA